MKLSIPCSKFVKKKSTSNVTIFYVPLTIMIITNIKESYLNSKLHITNINNLFMRNNNERKNNKKEDNERERLSTILYSKRLHPAWSEGTE